MSLVITKGASGTSATKADGSGYDWTGPVAIHVESNGDTMVSGGGQQPVFWQKSDVASIDGQAVAHNISDYRAQLIAVFPDASTGSGTGGGSFAEQTTATYTGGNKFKNISGSGTTTITVDATTGGVLLIYNSGSATTITFANTDSATKSFTINASGTNGGLTGFGIIIANGDYNITPDVNMKFLAIPAPDTTDPTVSSMEATDANTVEMTLSENGTGTIAGIVISINGTPTTITRSGSGTPNWVLTTTDPMTDTDVITWAITGSDIEDDAGNALADDSGSVTNSISAGGPVFEDVPWSNFKPDVTQTATGSHIWTPGSNVGGYSAVVSENKHLPAGVEGYYMVQYRPDLPLTDSYTLQWYPGGANASPTEYAAGVPMIGISYVFANVMIGNASGGTYPGSMGYNWTEAQTGPAKVSGRWYGFHRHANDDVFACWSDDLITFTDLNTGGLVKIGNYPADLYPAAGILYGTAYKLAFPKMNAHI